MTRPTTENPVPARSAVRAALPLALLAVAAALAPADGSALSLAAVWERWEAREQVIESFTILTTPASAELADIHHRQPAIVDPERFAEWLDPSTAARQLLEHLSTPHSGPYERRPRQRAREHRPERRPGYPAASRGAVAVDLMKEKST